jgi:hypothetical protein
MAVAPTAANTSALQKAIAQLAPNQTIQQALLVGSYGESAWDPNAAGSGGYGAFGFTSPEYTDPSSPTFVPPGATPSQQVAAILPAYTAAAAQVPSNLTGPAQAEWIALGAERPLNYQAQQQQIAATNRPTTYGANTSYSVQNWGQISGVVASQPAQNTSSSGKKVPLMGPCVKAKCIIGTPFGVGGCLMDDCQAKAFVSGLIVLGGVVTILVGVLALAGSTKAGRQIAELPMVGGAAAWGAKRMMGASGGGKVTEKKAQTRETAAYNRGHSEGKKMASQGSSVPKGSSYKPHPEDADFAVEAA